MTLNLSYSASGGEYGTNSGVTKQVIVVDGHWKSSGLGSLLWKSTNGQNFTAHHGTLTNCDGWNMDRYKSGLENATQSQVLNAMKEKIHISMGKCLSYQRGVGTRKDDAFYKRWLGNLTLNWNIGPTNPLTPHVFITSRKWFIQDFFHIAFLYNPTPIMNGINNESKKANNKLVYLMKNGYFNGTSIFPARFNSINNYLLMNDETKNESILMVPMKKDGSNYSRRFEQSQTMSLHKW